MFARDLLLLPAHGWIKPIPSWRASADERRRALKPFESAGLLADLCRQGDRDDLMGLYQLATGSQPWAPGALLASTLITAIERAVAAGELLLLRCDLTGRPVAAGQTDQTPHDLVIDAVLQGRTALSFEGRRYRFMPADRWSPRAAAEPYVALRAPAARELVARMAPVRAQSAADHAAWQALGDALTDRWSGTGILMLRHTPASAPSPKPDAPAATPSQLVPKVADQDWIELQMEFEDGTPFDGDVLLTVPGGRTIKGPPDPDGLIRVDGLDPGDCKLSIPAA